MSVPLKGDRIRVQMQDVNRSFEVTVTGDGQCRSCGSILIWTRTNTGKAMPVNARPDRTSGLFVSHFATCENADDWRRR